MGLGEAVTADAAAGIGFRHAATAAEIVELVRRALTLSGLVPGRLGRLATAADRAGEAAIREAADILAVPLVAIGPEALAAVDARVVTRSARIVASRHIGSVAEAAALAAAGAGGTLLLPRIAEARVTCALALAAQSVTQGA